MKLNDYKKFFEEVNKDLDRNIRRMRLDVKRIKNSQSNLASTERNNRKTS